MPISVSFMGFPSSSRTYMLAVSAFSLIRVSKLVFARLMPGCVLPDRTFFRMLVHVCWSVRASCNVSPFICRCRGGFGGPLSTAWNIVFLRIAWDRNRLAIVHS